MEILFIIFLILLNGLLALSELAVVSSRRTRLSELAENSHRGAKTALKLLESPSYLLSTIQVGITLIGIFAGAFGEASLKKYIVPIVDSIPMLNSYSDQIAFVVVVILITYLSLIFGELVPKRIAMSNPELFATLIAIPMRGFSKVVSPIVTILSKSTDFIIFILRIPNREEEPMSEEEIKVVIRQATNAGVLEKEEQAIINKIFQLGDKKIRDIMTPQTEVDWLDSADQEDVILQNIQKSHHSQFPVYQEDKENVLGFFHLKTFIELKNKKNKSLNLKKLVSKPVFVLETTSIYKVLEEFKKNNVHIGLVVNEYGSVEGLVTVNDIFEAIVGEVPDHEAAEEEKTDPKIITREDGSYLVDGILGIDELKSLLGYSKELLENENDIQTAGGFAMNQLQRVPTTGDSFKWVDYRFEVVDMDGNRVDKILISKIEVDEEKKKLTEQTD